MSITAVTLPLSFKGVQPTFKKADVPEIDPCYKYLFANSPEDEPTILKSAHSLNLLA